MSLLIAALFFAVFTTNIVIGSTGGQVFLTDVQEMLVLMAATLAFVVAILKKERARNLKDGSSDPREE